MDLKGFGPSWTPRRHEWSSDNTARKEVTSLFKDNTYLLKHLLILSKIWLQYYY